MGFSIGSTGQRRYTVATHKFLKLAVSLHLRTGLKLETTLNSGERPSLCSLALLDIVIHYAKCQYSIKI